MRTHRSTSARGLRSAGWWRGLVTGLLLSLSPLASATLPVAVEGGEFPSLAPMLERVIPAVVNISTRGEIALPRHPLLSDPFFQRFFGSPDFLRRRDTSSLGSGVIMDAAKGLIVTNEHVIRDASEISVTLSDGRHLDAELIGADPQTDVAVIRVEPLGLSAIPLADSDKLRVGDFVVAIGNPFGLGQTVTSGIVSALGRSGLGIEDYEDFIQTDASINRGNSGGALVNLRGELVGINTAILAPAGGSVGIGFAIPSNMARGLMTQLVSFGEVRRGLLGVALQDITPELAQAFDLPKQAGALVAQIKSDSPAARAGLQPGDVIIEINGSEVPNAAAVLNTLGLMQVGDAVTLTVLRDGRQVRVDAKLAERERVTADAQGLDPRLAGAVLSDIMEGMPLHGRIEGVLVAEVANPSNAARSGLREGDVITAANRVRVRSLEQLSQVLAARSSALMLHIQRGNASVFLVMQ